MTIAEVATSTATAYATFQGGTNENSFGYPSNTDGTILAVRRDSETLAAQSRMTNSFMHLFGTWKIRVWDLRGSVSTFGTKFD